MFLLSAGIWKNRQQTASLRGNPITCRYTGNALYVTELETCRIVLQITLASVQKEKARLSYFNSVH